ncbi:MAG: putative 4-hydroxybenzoate polyprenyltransferase [Phycisphaerales bacterium]|nr:putative 4-hydroxybenzoate polyprenyltransferase [Phycisphaerales bacterium]
MRSIGLVAKDIKISHTVFAMPFAILGASIAGGDNLAPKLAIVVACMVFARTWAMLVNRIADRRIDARNTRTRGRAIASGALPVRDAMWISLWTALAFIGCTALFLFFGNPWPLALSVPVLAWLAFYSFTKRFTWCCHLFLGGALGISPLAAGLALDPTSLGEPTLWMLGGFVVAWVAGFDVIYALQDLEFDRSSSLSSVPAAFGWRGAIWISRGLHVISLSCLVGVWRSEPRFAWIFGVGMVVVGSLQVLEHVVLARRGRAGIPMAFFTLNGVVSCTLGVAGVIDLIL